MQLTTQDKTLAVIQLLRAIVGAGLVGLSAGQPEFPALFVTANLAVAALGIASAIGSLRRQAWGIYGGLLFFALLLPKIVTPGHAFYLPLGFNVSFSVGWGTTQLGFDVIALIMLLWSWRRAHVRLKPRVAA
jgi:hypothetical protein